MSLQPYLQMVNAPEVVTVKGRIQSAGAATNPPDFQVPAGTFVSATHATTGVYTVKLPIKYPRFIGGIGSVHTAIGTPGTSTADLLVVFDVAGYDATTGILTFTVVGADGGTAAEAVPDNDWIYLELTFSRKTVLNQSGALAAG